MRLPKIAACVLLTTALLGAAAFANVNRLSVGSRDFDITVPAGYMPTSMYFPDIVRTFARFVPAGIQVYEVFLTRDEFNVLNNGGSPAMSSSFQLHVFKASEDRPLSAEGFAELSTALEAGLKSPPPGTQFVGIDAKEPWGLFYTMETDADGDTIWVGTGMVLVNHQLMQLLYYVDDDGPGSREKASAGVAAWARDLRAANPDKAWVAERAGKLDPALFGAKPTADDGSGLPYQIGRLLGMAAFIYIVYRLFRRR
jgi:hypothetical protein